MNLKTAFSANLQMKLFSLLLAALLWLFMALEAADEIEIPLTVNYVNTPPDLTVKAGQGTEPLLRIGGPRILLLRQKMKGTSVRVDLSIAKEGDFILTEGESTLKLVEGVKLVRFPPVHVMLSR